MSYIIISIIILVAVYYATYSISYSDETASALAGLIGIALIAIPFLNNFVGCYDEYVSVKKYNIASLELVTSESTQIKGGFILGCGTINGSTDKQIKYVFLSDEEYGKQIQTLDIKDVYLKETDEEVPQLIEDRKIQKRKHNIIDILWGEKDAESELFTTLERTILIVPKNTIKVKYNIEI